LASQVFVDLNGILHSNWAGLLELVSQPIIGKKTYLIDYKNNITKEDFGRDFDGRWHSSFGNQVCD
jgi:hypothetical protein